MRFSDFRKFLELQEVSEGFPVISRDSRKFIPSTWLPELLNITVNRSLPWCESNGVSVNIRAAPGILWLCHKSSAYWPQWLNLLQQREGKNGGFRKTLGREEAADRFQGWFSMYFFYFVNFNHKLVLQKVS